MAEAQARFAALGLTNIITRFGDGGAGWPEQAPFRPHYGHGRGAG